MSKKSWIFYLLFIIGFATFHSGVNAGSPNKKSIGYIFNANGSLLRIEGVKNDYPLLKKNRTIYFKIEDNNGSLHNRIKSVFNKYQKAFLSLKKAENQENLKNYFGFNSTEIVSLMRTYLSIAVFLNGKYKFEKDLETLGIDDNDSTQYYSADEVKSFKENIFSKLFTLKIFVANKFEPITLNFSESAELTNDEVKAIILSTGKKTGDGFRYELRYTSIESRYVETNLKAIQDNIPDAKKFTAASEDFNDAVNDMKSIMSMLREQNCENIRPAQNKINSLDTIHCRRIKTYLKENKEWIRLFLWYTGGVPSLIPFGDVPGDTSYKDRISKRNDTLTRNDSVLSLAKIELQGLTEKKNAFTSILAADNSGCDTCFGSIPDTLQGIVTRIEQINFRMKMMIARNDEVLKRNKEDKKKDSLIQVNIKKFQQKDVFLYSGKVIANTGSVTSSSGNTFVREHDAENGCTAINPFMDNYDATASVRILIENTTKKIEFTQFVTPVKDVSHMESLLKPALGEITDFLTNSNDFIKKDAKGDDCEDKINADTLARVIKDITFFNNILKYSPWYDYFKTPASSPLKHTQDTTGKNLPAFASSYKVSYQLKQGSRVDSFDYRKNKRYLFWPTAGFLYSFAKYPQVTINSDGTLSTKYYSGMHLMAGLKIHPWRTSIMDPSFVISCKRRPHVDYRKIYFVLGVDVLNIPNIYYVGAGIDLWSGLSINAGSQMIVKKQQKYVNGVVTSKDYLDWKNLYVGINIDLTLALKMVKFFTFK